jgi:hypothetical protein
MDRLVFVAHAAGIRQPCREGYSQFLWASAPGSADWNREDAKIAKIMDIFSFCSLQNFSWRPSRLAVP